MTQEGNSEAEYEVKFRDLNISHFKINEGQKLPPANDCQDLACRSCSPTWILDDVISSLSKRPITVGEPRTNKLYGPQKISPTLKFNAIKDHFDAISWTCKRPPGFFVPSWNNQDAGNIFLEETGKSNDDIEKNFEFDGVYFNGYSITVIEAFFHGNFKTRSSEREILNDETISTAFEKIKQNQNVMQSLVKLHTCRINPVSYIMFFPYVTSQKLLHEVNRSEDLKAWFQTWNPKLALISSDLLFTRKVLRLEFVDGQITSGEQDCFIFLNHTSTGNSDWRKSYQHLAASMIIAKKMSEKKLKFKGKKPETAKFSTEALDCKMLDSEGDGNGETSTNQEMSAVMDLWKDAPVEADKEEHGRIVENLSENQKMAVECLQDIIRTEKKGELVMTNKREARSDVTMLSVLMTSDWFSPSDMKTGKIIIHANPWKGTRIRFAQWQQRFTDEANRLRVKTSQALNINVSKVMVTIPELYDTATGINARKLPKNRESHLVGDFDLTVTVNAKDELIKDQFQLDPAPPHLYNQQTVTLTNWDEAVTKRVPVLQLKPEDLDSSGDKDFAFSKETKRTRGGMDYKQPSGNWIRVGLRVKGRYDNGNNDWLARNGNPREWAVAYHGSRSLAGNQGIATSREIKSGERQAFHFDEDINPLSDNKGDECGRGSYFAEDIETSADGYSADVNGRKCVFQVRLCPKYIRIPKNQQDYRIVKSADHARPYGICIKK